MMKGAASSAPASNGKKRAAAGLNKQLLYAYYGSKKR